jgi:hypothetical protein
MGLLNAEGISSARDRETVTVDVPEWEGEILIGTMGALDAAQLQDWLEPLFKPKEDEENDDTLVTCDSPEGKPENLEEGGEEQPSRPLTHSEHTEFMLRYLAATILDPQTYQPAFSRDEIEKLGQKNGKVLRRLHDAAVALHETIDEQVEGAAKNSVATPTGSSGGG